MKYWRVMLKFDGKDRAADCLRDECIGANYGILEDISGRLSGELSEFNRHFAPIFMQNRPGKTRIGAGLALGSLWRIAKDIEVGDVILSPASDKYHVGKVSGDYYYAEGTEFTHRRPVQWNRATISRANINEELRRTMNSRGTVVNITHHAKEIERLLGGNASEPESHVVAPSDNSVGFALEKHLEDFLVQNWESTLLGRDYDIYRNDDGEIAQQFPTDTGPIDILAVSKDNKTLLVVELKKGDASDRTVGQTLRYMGYIQEEIAEPGQEVRGAIIALNDDRRIQRALDAVKNVKFYRYKVKFDLI